MSTKSNFCLIDSEVICNQQVNVYGTRENPLFLAKDVANWLGHSNPSRMLSKIDEDEKITIFVSSELQKKVSN